MASIWQSWTDFENAEEKISKFHRQHPKKSTAPPKFNNDDKYGSEIMH